MASCNPVAPVMDWTEDAVTQEVHGMERGGRTGNRINTLRQV